LLLAQPDGSWNEKRRTVAAVHHDVSAGAAPLGAKRGSVAVRPEQHAASIVLESQLGRQHWGRWRVAVDVLHRLSRASPRSALPTASRSCAYKLPRRAAARAALPTRSIQSTRWPRW